VRYDDPLYVVDNGHVNGGWSWRDLGWCFQAGYAGNWHPLTWMSHRLDCQLYGMHSGGHHFTNLALHLSNSALLFLLLRRMTGALWRSAMVAALFAVHPLHVESVAWISERKDVLSTLFWLLAAWGYVRSTQEPKTRAWKAAIFYGLSLVAFALGLMAKPMLVTLPFVLLLLDWWPLGRLSEAHAADREGGIRRLIAALLVEKIPFLLLSIVSSALTIAAQKDDLYIASLGSIQFRSRLVNAAASYCHYLVKTFWPSDLGPMYPFVLHMPAGQLLAALLFLAAISAVALLQWRTRPYWLLGWLWFVGTLVPVIGVLRVGGQAMADRYTYIPSIGLFIIVSWQAYDLARGWRYHRLILGTLAATALALCCWLSRQQMAYWRDTETLFSRIPKTRTNNVGHANYARFLCNQNRLEEARLECEQALHISPRSGLYESLLANILLGQGKLDQAQLHFVSVLKRQPDLLEARLGLARTLLARRAFEGAAAQFATLLKYQPENLEAHAGLGQALIGQGREDQGRAELAEAARLARRRPATNNILDSP
jgi:tetratricopeptide (TPR) repeat protein